MSKLAETNALIDACTKIQEVGVQIDDYHAVLLDIAKSLAIIADNLSEKEEEEEA